MFSLSLAIVIASVWGFSATAQNLLDNGDFESPPYAPSSTVTGWIVSGNGNIHSIEEGSTSPTHSAALNVGGNSEGNVLSQSFATTVGALYRLDFDAAIFGIPDSDAPLSLNVQINGNTSLLNQTLLPPAANTFDPSLVTFRHYQFTFRADSPTTTLQFSDIGLGNSVADTVVDTVSVAPTPTPSPSNLVTNGDFETPPYGMVGTVAGWTVGGNGNVGNISEGATSGNHSAAFSAGGDSDGNTLSQTFSTIVGQQYTLDFDAGVYGPSTSSVLQLNVQVIGNATLVNQTVTPPAANTSNPNAVIFSHYHFTFTADSGVTTLRFVDIGTGNPITDIVLDSVSVPQPGLLLNGNFEAPPYETLGSITGWTVSGNGRVEEKMEGATSPMHSAVFGNGGDSQGNTLIQSFTTINGRMYSLDFDAAIFGVRSSAPLQLQVQVLGVGTLLDQTVTPPEADTYNPSAVTFQHYHFTFVANSATTTLQFKDIETGNASADPVLDTVFVLLQPIPTFAQWQALHFTAAQLSNPSISGWSADPDMDHIPNGLEYFFNTDPLAGIPMADKNSFPRVSVSSSGASQYLTYTYRRIIGWMGPPEVVSVSDDLLHWDNTQNQIEPVGSPVPSGDGSTEIVTVRLKTPINQGPIPRKFLRLNLTQ